jgi:ABC-type enterochelin transport system permease subunit
MAYWSCCDSRLGGDANGNIFQHKVSDSVIDIGMSLVALAIVLSILIGGTLPFFGSVVLT